MTVAIDNVTEQITTAISDLDKLVSEATENHKEQISYLKLLQASDSVAEEIPVFTSNLFNKLDKPNLYTLEQELNQDEDRQNVSRADCSHLVRQRVWGLLFFGQPLQPFERSRKVILFVYSTLAH